jgi:lactocepin
MTVGSTSQTSVVFSPSQSAVPVTIWTSSNQRVASVSTTGLVRALQPGTATITASVNGKSASRVVTVR